MSKDFDKNNKEDIKWLEHCKNNPKNWVEESQVYIWANRDVKKREIAIKNKLNYVQLYTYKEIEEYKKELEKYKKGNN